MKTVLAVLLAVVLTTLAPRATAQVVCTHVNVGGIEAPLQTQITYTCSLQNYNYQATFTNTTGIFSTANGSGQVPRIPHSMSITYGWDSLSGLGTYMSVNVRNPSGSMAEQYTFGFGAFLMSPAIDAGNGTQTALINTVNWPSEFTLEFVQYNSFYGVTQTSFDIRLFN